MLLPRALKEISVTDVSTRCSSAMGAKLFLSLVAHVDFSPRIPRIASSGQLSTHPCNEYELGRVRFILNLLVIAYG